MTAVLNIIMGAVLIASVVGIRIGLKEKDPAWKQRANSLLKLGICGLFIVTFRCLELGLFKLGIERANLLEIPNALAALAFVWFGFQGVFASPRKPK